MTTSYYRIQPTTYAAEDLLVAENQISVSWRNGEDTRNGVSVCCSREELAAYLAQVGIPFEWTWNLVEVEGYPADEDDEDHALGARLIIPTRIVSVESMTNGFADEIIAAYDAAQA